MNTRGERGRLYWINTLPAKRGEKEARILIRALTSIGTFEAVVADLGRPEYDLELDDRFQFEYRLGAPGYVVFGVSSLLGVEEARHGDKEPRRELVGAFIPENTEREVVFTLASELYCPITLIPFAYEDLAGVIPAAIPATHSAISR